MKYKILLSILFNLLISATCVAQDSTNLSNPDTFGFEVYRAFKSNDFELFYSLIISEEEYEVILDKMEINDSLKSVYRQQDKRTITYLQGTAETNFNSILEMAKQLNIDWKNTEVTEIQTLPRNKNNQEKTDIVVHVKWGDTPFILVLSACVKGSKWNIMNEVKLIS